MLRLRKKRAMFSACTNAALAAAKARGTKLGSPRLAEARAATNAASREADCHAALVLPAILPLREQGMTSREIANELRERGVPTARSGKWAPRRSSTSSDANRLT
jgi:hypothetical protein